MGVGDPGPLSPDDSERLREERLRLVCSRDACLVILRNREVRFLLLRDGNRDTRLLCKLAPVKQHVTLKGL